jgi:hypothetical protein
MRLAFRNAELAAKSESNRLEILFSEQIAKVTGGKFSHVECVLAGPLSAAQCFAAVEPHGCRYALIDLTQPTGMWTVLETPTTADEDRFISGFCAGAESKPYDMGGIIGIGSEDGLHVPWQRFCSEFAAELCQAVGGLGIQTNVPRWMVAPSGPSDGKRYGLYEMCIAAGWKVIQ